MATKKKAAVNRRPDQVLNRSASSKAKMQKTMVSSKSIELTSGRSGKKVTSRNKRSRSGLSEARQCRRRFPKKGAKKKTAAKKAATKKTTAKKSSATRRPQ